MAASDAEEGFLGGQAREAKTGQRRARLAAGALASMGLLAAVAALSSRGGTAESAFEEAVSLSSVKKPDKMKMMIADRMKGECSKVLDDCSTSKCCRNFGFQCFEKNSTWGTCLKKCTPSLMKTKGNGTWTCKALGEINRCARQGEINRCARQGENCLSFGCCADVGSQCYAKNKLWGTCMKTCSPSQMEMFDPVKGDWTCDPIGPRNTIDYRTDYVKGFVPVEPWIKNCSSLGDNCMSTKCCAYSGYSCYQKNESWAGCVEKCFPGKWNGGMNEKPMVQPGKPLSNPPKHWNVTFSMAPPGPWTCKRLTPPMKYGYLVGTSLYCFTVALTDNGGSKKPQELEILKEAQRRYAHVFACDHWTVYSDLEVKLNPGKTMKVYHPQILRRPNTKIWVNTLMFLTVWKEIRQQETWKSFPWIVKSDPAAVFIPSRLRKILSHQHVTQNGIFLENCKASRMSLHGSLEVMSNTAFGTFLEHLEDCQRVLPWQNAVSAHFRYYGEDKFLAWCMHTYGVDKLPSLQMVETVPKDQPIQGLHLTPSCPAHRSPFELHSKKWHPNCTRAKTASIHAFRTVKNWLECYQNTTAQN